MQITNHVANKPITTDVPFDLKNGEIYSAGIKERLSDKEAVLQIRGREVVAQFEDKVPMGDRATVQVTGQQDQKMTVKEIAVSSSPVNKKSTELTQILQKVGLTGKETAELREAVKLLLDKGAPLSKEIVSELKTFFDKAGGSPEAKADTVRALVNKGLEVTQTHLRSIHEALHGKPLNEVLNNIAKELNLDMTIKDKPVAVVRPTQPDAPQIPNNKVPVSNQVSNRAGTAEVLSSIRNMIEKEPDLQKALTAVKEIIANNPKIDREVAKQIEKVAGDAEKLQSIGKERIIQALRNAEAQLGVKEQQPVESKATVARNPVTQDLNSIVRELKNEVPTNPNLQRSIDRVVTEVLKSQQLPRESAEKMERAVNEATSLLKQGRVTAGREVLTTALANLENEVVAAQSRQAGDGRTNDTGNRAPIESRPAETVNRQPVDSRPVETNNRQPVAESRPAAETNIRQQTEQQRASEVIRQVKETVQQEPRMQKAVELVRDQIVSNPKIDREVAQKIERAVQEATQLQKLGQEGAGRERLAQALASAEVEMKQAEASRTETAQRQPVESRPAETINRQPVESRPVETNSRQPVAESRPAAETNIKQQVDQSRASEVIRQVKEAVQQEPRLQKAVEQVRDQIVNNPKIDREVAQKIERAVQEATQLQKLGHEGAGRERLAQALASAEVEMKQAEASRAETAQRQPVETTNRQPVESRPTETTSRQPAESRPGETATRQPATPSQDSAALRDSIKQIREQLQSEPDVKKVLPKIQEQIINNKSTDPEVARNIEKAANQANQLNEAGRERLLKLLQQMETSLKQTDTQQNVSNPKSTTELTDQNGKQVAQTQGQQAMPKLEQKSQEQTTLTRKLPSETLQQALKQFQSQSDVDKALELVRKEVSSNPNIDMANVSKIEKALDNAQQLSDRGREIAARQQVTKELTDIQQSLANSEPKTNPAQTASTQYDVNELLQSMQIQSKDILVTRVTQKLAEATQEFRDLKREITRTLDSVQRNIDLFKGNSIPQASKMLETAISKLDNAILKSDLMLFTDMKQEKQLLQASSQLAEAKKLLAKGNFSEASKIVGQVKDLIDKINFKPTDQKVMHYVGKESLAMENRNHALETAARGYTMPEPSAKQMYEMVRSMGLNHDSDLANSLVFKNGEQQAQQEQHQQNMKAVLMKIQQEEAGTRVAQQAEQALNNLTGQQLLSKADGNGTMQSMLFNLPLLLGGDPRDLQVFVNSKNEGQQVDWENCNLYFLIETKKLGDVGIMLTSTERNLSITIKNDKPGFKEKMEPIASVAKEKLKEIGYNVSGLHFTRMTPVHTETQTDQTIEPTPKKPIFTEKGLDFKI